MFSNFSKYTEGHLHSVIMKMELPDSPLSMGLSPYSNLSSPFETTTETYSVDRNESGIEGDPDHDISDFWAIFNSENLQHSIGWSIFLIIAYGSILLGGAIGNSLVILVMLLKPPMRTVTRMFLINLAVADLLVTVFCVPATLLANLFRPWILGLFMCKGVAYVQGVSVCASAYSLAALSLDRYKAIYRPMGQHKGISKRQAWITILLIWIFSSLITLPWLFVFEVVKSDEDGYEYCIETWRNEHLGKVYFLVTNLIFGYTVPFMIIAFSNISIWCRVSKREVPQDSASIRRIHKKTRHGVRKTLSIVTSAYIISWLPLYVLATILKFSSVDIFEKWQGKVLYFLLPIVQWLGSLNSSMNPIFYAFFNSKFRNGFQTLFHALISKYRISVRRKRYHRQRSQEMIGRQNSIILRILSHNPIETDETNNVNDCTSPC